MKGFTKIAKIMISILGVLSVGSIVNLIYTITSGNGGSKNLILSLLIVAIAGFALVRTFIVAKKEKEHLEKMDDDIVADDTADADGDNDYDED